MVKDGIVGINRERRPYQAEGQQLGRQERFLVDEDRQEEGAAGGDVLQEPDRGQSQQLGAHGEKQQGQAGHQGGPHQHNGDRRSIVQECAAAGVIKIEQVGRGWD